MAGRQQGAQTMAQVGALAAAGYGRDAIAKALGRHPATVARLMKRLQKEPPDDRRDVAAARRALVDRMMRDGLDLHAIAKAIGVAPGRAERVMDDVRYLRAMGQLADLPVEAMPTTPGDYLRIAREARGLTLIDAAAKAGVSFQSWSAWERGLVHAIPTAAWEAVAVAPMAAHARRPRWLAEGQALAVSRLKRKLTASDCAARIGVGESTWFAWESGVTAPPSEAFEVVGVTRKAPRSLGARVPRAKR